MGQPIRSRRAHERVASARPSSPSLNISSSSLCDPAAVSSDVLLPEILRHLSGEDVYPMRTTEQRLVVQQSLQRWRSVFMVWRKVLDCDALLLTLLLHSGCLWSPNYERVYPVFQRHIRGIANDDEARQCSRGEEKEKWCKVMESLNTVYPFDMWAIAVTHFLNVVEIFSLPTAGDGRIGEDNVEKDEKAEQFQGDALRSNTHMHKTPTEASRTLPTLPVPSSSMSATHPRHSLDFVVKKRGRVIAEDGVLGGSFSSARWSSQVTVEEDCASDDEEEEGPHGIRGATSGSKSLRPRYHFHSTNEFFPEEHLSLSKANGGSPSFTPEPRGRPRGVQRGGTSTSGERSGASEMEHVQSSSSSCWWLCTIGGDNEIEQQRVGTLLVDRWFDLMGHPYLASDGTRYETEEEEEEARERHARHLWFASAIKFAAFVDGVDCPLVEENVHITSVVARCGREWSTIATLLHRSIPSIFLCLLEQEVVLETVDRSNSSSAMEGHPLSDQDSICAETQDDSPSKTFGTSSPKLALPPLTLLMPFHLCGQGSCVSLMKTPYVLQQVLQSRPHTSAPSALAGAGTEGRVSDSTPSSAFRARRRLHGFSRGHSISGSPHPTAFPKRTSNRNVSSSTPRTAALPAARRSTSEGQRSANRDRYGMSAMPRDGKNGFATGPTTQKDIVGPVTVEGEEDEMEAKVMIGQSKVANMWLSGLVVTSHGFVVHHPTARTDSMKENYMEDLADEADQVSGLVLRFSLPTSTDSMTVLPAFPNGRTRDNERHSTLSASPTDLTSVGPQPGRLTVGRPSRRQRHHDSPYVKSETGDHNSTPNPSAAAAVHSEGNSSTHCFPISASQLRSRMDEVCPSWSGNIMKIPFLRIEEAGEEGGRTAERSHSAGLHPRLLLLKPIPRHALSSEDKGSPSFSSGTTTATTALVYPYTLLYTESVSFSATTTMAAVNWFKGLYPGVDVEGVPELNTGTRKSVSTYADHLIAETNQRKNRYTNGVLPVDPGNKSPQAVAEHETALLSRRKRGRRPRVESEQIPLLRRYCGGSMYVDNTAPLLTAPASILSDSWIHCCFSRDPCAHFLQSLFRMARRALSMRGVALASVDSLGKDKTHNEINASQNTIAHPSHPSSSSVERGVLRFQWHTFSDETHELIVLLQMAHTFALLPLVLGVSAGWIRFPKTSSISSSDTDDVISTPLWLTHAISFLTDLSIHVPISAVTDRMFVRRLFFGASLGLALHPKTTEMTLVAVGWVSRIVQKDCTSYGDRARLELQRPNYLPIQWTLFLYDTVYRRRTEWKEFMYSRWWQKEEEHNQRSVIEEQSDDENWLSCCVARGVQLLIKKACMEVVPPNNTHAKNAKNQTPNATPDYHTSAPRSSTTYTDLGEEGEHVGVLEKWRIRREKKHHDTLKNIHDSKEPSLVKETWCKDTQLPQRRLRKESVSVTYLCGDAVTRYKDQPPQILIV